MAALRVVRSLAGAARARRRKPDAPRASLACWLYSGALLALAAVCGYLTWREILGWVAQDIAAHGSAAYWLAHSKAFVRAYVLVADSAAGWWWSSQLLLFVAPLMAFFRVHALRLPELPVLPYVLLGFLGAISLATPLFLLALSLREPHAHPWAALLR